MKPVVDAAWLEGELGADDLFLGDVRGPNAHARGHLPGSKPLVLGSPPPMSDRATMEALAAEVGLRLRRHGVTGEERLVLYDRGDGVGAMPAAQLAELAGHPRVAVLLGGDRRLDRPARDRRRSSSRRCASSSPRTSPPCRRATSCSRASEDPELTVLDVRRPEEYTGRAGSACDPRQGRIPGARHLEAARLFGPDGLPLPPEQVRELVGLPEGAEIVAYCHSGSRSAFATLALRAAGYRARNYAGSWHEWSRHPELPAEKG